MKYIITSKNEDGTKGILCYSTSIGKGRIYRQVVGEINKGLKPFEYKTPKRPQELADLSNRVNNTNIWQVEQILNQNK